MKRYPAYDPPEYVGWEADPGLIIEYARRVTYDPERAAIIAGLSETEHLDLYRGLIRFRLHDIALRRWVKLGTISKAWLGTGEEAVTIGAVHALRRGPNGDVVAPMIRNAGACHEMGIPLADMFRAYLGTADSPTRGRDLHFGDASAGVLAPVSMVGSVSTVVNGYGLAFRARGEDRVALTWIGDGSTKCGEVHEALNMAAVLRLPVVFILQNNQIALGTSLEMHHRAGDFSAWGDAYGMPLFRVDGNHVLDVYAATSLAVQACRAGSGPVMIEAETFRMGGHATHDESEARAMVEASAFAEWGKRDPIGQYEEYLVRRRRPQAADPSAVALHGEEGARALLARIEAEVTSEVEASAEEALRSRETAVLQGDASEISSCCG